MWSLDLFQDVVRLSNPGATFATFTAAGHVRRNLQSVGFDVQKFEGFGRKKEMLKGRLRLTEPVSPKTQSKNQNKRALIVGAGLAGTSTAYELAERNWDVVIVDRHAQIASESSGNPWGMYYPLLTKNRSALSEFSLQAYDYLLRRLHATTPNETSTPQTPHTHGILQLKRRDKDFDRYSSAMEWVEPSAALMTRLSPEDVSQLAGIHLNEEGLFFPQAGCLRPADFCRSQTNAHSNIRFIAHLEVNVSNLQWNPSSDVWLLQAPQETIEADTVIFCNASGAKQFPWSSHLNLGVNRGQLCEVSATPSSSKLKTILAGDFYLTPGNQDQHLLGATYDRENLDLVVKESDNRDLISRTHLASPDLDLTPENIVSSRTAHRTSTTTKLPIVGMLASAPGPAAVNIGHGSRGIVYAPLSSQILADLLSDMPMAASLSLWETLKPQS